MRLSCLVYFQPWRLQQHIPKQQSIFNRPHGVITQELELYITSAVRTSFFKFSLTLVAEPEASTPPIPKPNIGHDPEPVPSISL
jgi:hypothetical protein